MKRISSLVILVVILALLNGLAFAEFDSTSANLTNQYFPVQGGDWFRYVGYGNMAGETETWEGLGTEFVNSVNCLKIDINGYLVWFAQDTDGIVWLQQLIHDGTVLTPGSGISYPFMPAQPIVENRVSHIFQESAGTYGEVTRIGVDVDLSTSLGPYENCVEITNYYDYEVEELEYYCPGIGLVKIIYPQEGPPETGKELSEFGSLVQDIKAMPWIPLLLLGNRSLITINWFEYRNWEVGRAWQFQTSGSEGTFSAYIKETTTKESKDVYVKGWSGNWSDQLDYWFFDANGLNLLGMYDEYEMQDVFMSPPYQILNTFEVGKVYTQTIMVGDEERTAITTFEMVNNVSVPYGTFDDVIKVTFKTTDETRLSYYARNVGMIKSYKTSSNRTDVLLNITDGHTSQPPN